LVKRVDLVETDTTVFSEVAELLAVLVQLSKVYEILVDFVKFSCFRCCDEQRRCVSAFNRVFP
jgi:hypothetical protein